MSNKEKNVINVDPATLLLFVVVLLFVPLILAGFLSQ